jgi:DNA-binding CsgD family transcriptional regulator
MSDIGELEGRFQLGAKVGDFNVNSPGRPLLDVAFAGQREKSLVADDLVDVLGVVKFPAWVEAPNAKCLYYNGGLLGSLPIEEDLRRQVSEQLARLGTLGGVIAVRQKNAVQRMLDAVIYPLFVSGHAFVPEQTLQIVVVCDSTDRAERDRDVSFALWGKLLQGNAMKEESALSPQQKRIYRLLRKKMTYKEMAAELGVAHSTIRVQVAEIRKLLGSSKVPVLRRSFDKPV